MLSNNRFIQNLVRFLLLVVFSFSLSSCTDQGCIDADDFGEYETQTITVTANASQEKCNYNAALSLTDSEQGSGIKDCFTQGNVTIEDETGTSLSSTTGCVGFTDAKFQNLCVNNCVQTCLSSVGSANAASAEPAWNSTDKKGTGQNSGVTIRPGSQVIVRAVGTVSLGSNADYPDLFLKADDPLPHSLNSSWQNTFFDVRSGQALGLNFSGRIKLADNGTTDPAGQTNSSATGPLYNIARRLVVYTIPHPESYGGFDLTQTTEKAGVKTVPLWPDSDVWGCTYSGIDTQEATCTNALYTADGYTNVDDGLASSTFPVTTEFRSPTLSTYGGMIRWENDGLKSGSYDPFTSNSVTCDGVTGACANIANVPGNEGQIIGDLSSGAISIQNPYTDSFKVSFRTLTGDSGCDATYDMELRDSAGNVIHTFTAATSSAVSISNLGFVSPGIDLEPGQQLFINTNSATYSGGVNCGRVTGIRFLKYYDLPINQSGFVRFSVLGGSTGSCVIKGRIINPGGDPSDIDLDGDTVVDAGSADFYEYGTYNDPLNDPLAAGLAVQVSPNYAPVFTPGTASSTQQVFVRNGQEIRFDPTSWDGTWTTSNSLTRDCGIGMAMVIDPRPSLICRGAVDEAVNNTACLPDVDVSGELLGCQETAPECDDPDTSSFCAYPACIKAITCDAGSANAGNNYTKQNCVFDPAYVQADCDAAIEVGLPVAEFPAENAAARSNCGSCSSKRLTNAARPALVNVAGISQCYDLESYTGKVSNIPLNPGSLSDVDTFLAGPNANGANKLQGFNGIYGNVSSFADSGETSTGGKTVYNANSQYIISNNSRLRIMLLDGENMNNEAWNYSDNTSPSGNYSGTNGIQVGFSGSLDFRNGQWMEVILCQESSNSNSNPSDDCKSLTTPPNFANSEGLPELINITAPDVSTPVGSDPVLTGNYAFDANGNLFRHKAGQVSGDCTRATEGLQTAVGDGFYCHNYEFYTTLSFEARTEARQEEITSNIQKLRLSFKILDPEISDCTMAGGIPGLKTVNPFYDADVAANVGALCGAAEIPGDGSTAHPGTCEKQEYCESKYANNSGQYYVNVKVKSSQNDSISSIITAVVNPIVEIMDGKQDDPDTAEDESTVGQAERIYKLLITDPRYKSILTVCLVVMFTFWGVGYLLGVSELNHSEIITRVFKIGFIYLMVGETGWEWFNTFFVAFFKDGTDYLSFMMASSFDDSPELASAIDTGDLYDKSVLFSSVDSVFNLFFSSAVQKKISALMFASIFGWAYLVIIWWSFLHYVYAVANAVLLYLTAQIFISIMFILGPIFFVFMIFSQTKEMFDNWLKQLIGFSLQQIFLLITLAFFNMLMYEVLKMSLGYKICWDEVWVMNLGITRISLMSFWTIASLPPRTNANSQVGNIGNPEGIPSIFTILFIWVIASLMEQFIGFMTDLASSISGGLQASALASGIKDAAGDFNKKWIQPGVDAAWDITAGAVGREVDDKLFDSGKNADDRRTKQEAQEISDRGNKREMAEAGPAAAEKFRNENASMGDKERDAGAAKASEAAMKARGTAMGLKDKDVERLMDDKGVKTGGATNALTAIYKAVKGRQTALTSLREQANKAGQGTLSKGESKAAQQNMTSGQRKDHENNIRSGKTKVGRGVVDGVTDVATGKTSVSEGVSNAASSVAGGAGSMANASASAVVKAATGQNMNVAQSAKEMLGMDKDVAEARKQLESENQVQTLASGAQFTASRSDKDKIRARAAEIKKDREVNVVLPDTAAADSAKQEAEHLNKIDEINKSDSSEEMKFTKRNVQRAATAGGKAVDAWNAGIVGTAKGMASGGNSVANAFRSAGRAVHKARGKEGESQFQEHVMPVEATNAAEVLDKGLEERFEANTKEISSFEGRRSNAMKVVKKHKAKVDAAKANIAALQLKSGEQKKAGLSVAMANTNAELEKAQKDLDGDKDYQAHQEATAAVYHIDARVNSHQQANVQIDSMRNDIKAAKEIGTTTTDAKQKAAYNSINTVEGFTQFANDPKNKPKT